MLLPVTSERDLQRQVGSAVAIAEERDLAKIPQLREEYGLSLVRARSRGRVFSDQPLLIERKRLSAV